MATLSTDTFTRANQSGWGTASDGESWSTTVDSPTLNIASNEGTCSTGTFSDSVMRIGSQTTADINFLMRCKVANGNAGPVWRYQDTNNYYRCVQEDGGTLFLQKRISGSNSTITTVNPSGFSTGSFFWIRVIASGTSIKVTWWLDGNSEPGTPNIDTTDSAITSAGGYGIGSVGYGGGANSFDSLTVTDNQSITTSTRTATAEASLLQKSTRTATSEAGLLQQSTRTGTSSASLLQKNTRTGTSNAALLQQLTRTGTSEVALLQKHTNSATAEASLLQKSTRTSVAEADLLQTNTRTSTANATLLQTNTRTGACSASLSNTRTAQCEVSLLQKSTRIATCNASLSASGSIPSTNAIVYVRSGKAIVYVRKD
jgi:hypothetical protein